MAELAFFPDAGGDPLKDHTVEELLSGNVGKSRGAIDGFEDYFALKLCTSNAKQTARYFCMALGFEEVAFKSLENNSRLVASHVVCNGNVTFEFVSTLETVEEDSPHNLPTLNHNPQELQACIIASNQQAEQLLSSTLKEHLKNVLCDNSRPLSDYGQLAAKVLRKSMNSKDFRHFKSNYQALTETMMQCSEKIYNDLLECATIQRYLKRHGEGVIDVSFRVHDATRVFNRATSRGAGTVRAPRTETDANGSMKTAIVIVPNTDILHTFVEVIDYDGPYMPGYSTPVTPIVLPLEQAYAEKICLECIDHCVENYSWNQMMDQARFYANTFGFRKYWSVDETMVFTGESALRSVVMALSNGRIKMPINEPVLSKKRGQIEEFNHFNGGPGVQHIALRSRDIISTVRALKARGVEFNPAPPSYYDTLRKRLFKDSVSLKENISELEEYGILADYDASTRKAKTSLCNYILQIFTRPLHDRPTLFLEIIQRRHHDGFGKGTFKGLYETIESQQKLRGTLVDAGEPFD